MQNSKTGRSTNSLRSIRRQVVILMSVVLFIALSMVPGTRVNAQVQCISACEQQFAMCLRNGGNNSAFAPTCLDTYEACIDACLGASAALL